METHSQDSNETFGLAEIRDMILAELDSIYTAIQPKLENRVEGQSWAVGGVCDSTFSGQREAAITVLPWGLDILIRSLTGEQRHRILNAAIDRGGPSNDAIYDIVLNGAFDPLTGKSYWKSKGQLGDLDCFLIHGLARAILHLSGALVDSRWDAKLERRASPNDGDLHFLLRAVHLTTSDSNLNIDRDHITSHWLWKHEGCWRKAHDSAYGYIGNSLKNEFNEYREHGRLEGDYRPESDLVFTNERSLGYLGNREELPARSKRCPDLATQEDGILNAHHEASASDEIEPLTDDIELDTILSRQEVQTSPYGRNYYDSWVVARASRGNDFQVWIDRAVDIRRAFEAVRIGTTEPVQERTPLRPPMAGALYRPPAVKHVSDRTIDLVKRDTETFIERFLCGVPRSEMTRAEWSSVDRICDKVFAWLKEGGYVDWRSLLKWDDRQKRCGRKRIRGGIRQTSGAIEHPVVHDPNDSWDWRRHTATYRQVPYVSWEVSREVFCTTGWHEPQGTVRRPQWRDWWGTPFNGEPQKIVDTAGGGPGGSVSKPRKKWQLLPPLDDPDAEAPAEERKEAEGVAASFWKPWVCWRGLERDIWKRRVPDSLCCMACGRSCVLRNDRVRFIVRGTAAPEGDCIWPLKVVCPAAYAHYAHGRNAEVTKRLRITVIRLGDAKHGKLLPPREPELMAGRYSAAVAPWQGVWLGGVDYRIRSDPKPVWGDLEPATAPTEPVARFYVRCDQGGPWSEANTIPVFHA
jgi:hypothetical protein